RPHPWSTLFPYTTLFRSDPLKVLAAGHDGGLVDLSVGTPCDPPSAAVVAALGASGTEAGYPTSIGSPGLREAATGWLNRRFGVRSEEHTSELQSRENLVC